MAVEVLEDKHSSSSPISCNVNFEPTFLGKSRWCLFCLSLCRCHFSLYTNKKSIAEFSNVSCDSIYKYFANNRYISFKNSRHFPHSFLWRHFHFGSATAPAYDQPLKLFTFLSSFSPLTSQLFCLFSFLNVHLSSYSAFNMQQVTSHIPLFNQFFSDLIGFSEFFFNISQESQCA